MTGGTIFKPVAAAEVQYRCFEDVNDYRKYGGGRAGRIASSL